MADDAGNTVWRVAPSDGAVTPEPVGSDGQRRRADAGAQTGEDSAPGAARTDSKTVKSQSQELEAEEQESVEDSASEDDIGDAVSPTSLTTVPAVNSDAEQNSEQQQGN